MKRRPNRTVCFLLLVLLLIALAFFILSMVKNNQPGNASVELAENSNDVLLMAYQEAEELMYQGNYQAAAAKFDALSLYSDSSQMATYCRALDCLNQEKYDTAISAFRTLGSFRDCQQLQKYAAGLQCETEAHAQDLVNITDEELTAVKNLYSSAINKYESILLFRDCSARIDVCEAGIAAVEAEQNQRENAEKARYYDRAERYRAKHDYKTAVKNYELSIGYKDSTEKLAELNKYALEYVSEEIEGLIAVKGTEGYGFINGKGETVIPCVYSDVHSFSEGLAAVQMDYKWGYVNKLGELIIPYTWVKVSDFHDGLAAVSYDGETWRYIDQNGVEVISGLHVSDYTMYEIRGAGNFSEGRCVVTYYDPMSSNRYDFYGKRLYDSIKCIIDKEGNYIANYREDMYTKESSSFSEGLAVAGNKYIDKNGQTVLQFDDNLRLGEFKDGYAKVWNNDKYDNRCGLIDRSGRLVVPCEWHDITYAGDDVLLTSTYETDSSGYSGFVLLSAISLDGSVYVEPNENTDHIMYQDGVFLLFCRDGYLYLMDRDGNYLN